MRKGMAESRSSGSPSVFRAAKGDAPADRRIVVGGDEGAGGLQAVEDGHRLRDVAGDHQGDAPLDAILPDRARGRLQLLEVLLGPEVFPPAKEAVQRRRRHRRGTPAATAGRAETVDPGVQGDRRRKAGKIQRPAGQPGQTRRPGLPARRGRTSWRRGGLPPSGEGSGTPASPIRRNPAPGWPAPGWNRRCAGTGRRRRPCRRPRPGTRGRCAPRRRRSPGCAPLPARAAGPAAPTAPRRGRPSP